MEKQIKAKRFFDFLAFIAIIAVAVSLIISFIFKATAVAGALDLIASCLAYLITAFSAFFYVRAKSSAWAYITYFVALILIVVFVIL